MFVGILFSVIVSLTLSLFGFFTFLKRKAIPSQYRSGATDYFCYFWLGISLVWFFIAIADFFAYWGMFDLTRIFVYILQVCIGFSLMVALYYTESIISIKHFRTSLFVLYYVFLIIYFISLFSYGFLQEPASFFAIEFRVPLPTLSVYLAMFVPLFLWSFYILGKTIEFRKLLKKPLFHFQILGSLSIIILGVSGTVDQMGLVLGWSTIASRILVLVASIIAFIAVISLQVSDELVV